LSSYCSFHLKKLTQTKKDDKGRKRIKNKEGVGYKKRKNTQFSHLAYNKCMDVTGNKMKNKTHGNKNMLREWKLKVHMM